jgi:hypothetical protein
MTREVVVKGCLVGCLLAWFVPHYIQCNYHYHTITIILPFKHYHHHHHHHHYHHHHHFSGMVINSLSDGAPHIPYRDSKLTMLLMDALGGNSKVTNTVVVINYFMIITFISINSYIYSILV